MQCSRCQGENPADAASCQHCGDKLELICNSCQTANTADSNFCRNCGARLAGQPASVAVNPPPAAAQAAVSEPYVPAHLAERFRAGHAAFLTKRAGERKIITVLFADIKGSMALLDGMDPDFARQVIDPALRLMMNAVYRYDGYVTEVLGDGIVALFGAPIAREDHARLAIYGALGMQERMKEYGAQLLRDHGLPPIQIRVGINSGEVVVRSIATDDQRAFYASIGHSTGLAARIQAIAAPGSVVVGDSTHRLTDGFFEFRDLGSVPMKGVSGEVGLYEVAGVGPLRTRLDVSASHGLARFIGRRDELERMGALFDLAKKGRGQIVGVVGEGGVGKSRLFHEFKQLARDDCLVLECSSASYGKAFPYQPLVDMLKSYFQIVTGQGEREILDKVTERVLALDHALQDIVPFLCALLSPTHSSAPIDDMDPRIRRQRTFSAIQRLVLRESRDRPVLMIMEDLHWLDDESQSFLMMFGSAVEQARILLAVNYRREYQPTWDAATSPTLLRLNPFGREDAGSLLAALLGENPALDALKSRIIDQTEGNAFFMEEYVRTLFERGILRRGQEIELTRMPSRIEMPQTVQGMLAARIDRLQPEHKAFLQMLAVLGMANPLRLIERLADRREPQVQEILDRLLAAEFIFERPGFPDVEYVFEHALTREAAYGQLLADVKRTLHSRAAEAMEQHFSDSLDDHCSELAYHYGRSDNRPKAVDFLQRAARQAMRQSAYETAIDHVTSALTMLPGLADEPARASRELQLQSMLGAAWTATRGFAVAEVSQAYGRARELCRDWTDSADLIRVLDGSGLLYINRGELNLARDIGEQLLTLAERRHEPELFVSGHGVLGLALLRVGDLIDCRVHIEQAIRHHVHVRDSARRDCLGRVVSARALGALGLWLLGYPDQAVAGTAEALRTAHTITPPHPFSLAYAMVSAAWVHQFRGEAAFALQEAQASIEFATEKGLPGWLPHGLLIQGWAEAEVGKVEGGVAHIEHAVQAYQTTGAKVWLPLFLLVQGRALWRIGKPAEALERITTALRLASDMGRYWWDAELLRLRGELLIALAEANAAEAQACFANARALAQTQRAKSLELRACASLARLARRHGGQAEALNELAAVCEWFSEGQNTADLIEARELIDRLS
jgi:class 3 adenylate cyclase/predicted ATPase